MSELNSHMIQRLGWFTYLIGSGLGGELSGFFQNDRMVRFFFINFEQSRAFVIKEMTRREKQKTNNLYKFIKFRTDDSQFEMCVDEFSTNQQLFKLIIENGAMANEYKRNFTINKILL